LELRSGCRLSQDKAKAIAIDRRPLIRPTIPAAVYAGLEGIRCAGVDLTSWTVDVPVGRNFADKAFGNLLIRSNFYLRPSMRAWVIG